MSKVISGITGPIPMNQAGAYGQNAALKVQKAVPETLLTTNIRYAPKNNPQSAENALGYAKQDIAQFDTNKDGALDPNEIATNVFGAQKALEPLADQYLKVLDSNDNGKIELPEMAAFILYQDNSMGTAKAFADAITSQPTTAALLEKGQVDALKQAFDETGLDAEARKALRSKADGCLTPVERAFAEGGVSAFPSITKLLLAEYQGTFDLTNQAKKFQ